MTENTTLREVLRNCDPRLKHFQEDVRILRYTHAGGVQVAINLNFDAMNGDFHTEESKKEIARIIQEVMGIWEKIPSRIPVIFHVRITTVMPTLRYPERPVTDSFEICFSNFEPSQKYDTLEFGKAYHALEEGSVIFEAIEEVIERNNQTEGFPSDFDYQISYIYLLKEGELRK